MPLRWGLCSARATGSRCCPVMFPDTSVSWAECKLWPMKSDCSQEGLGSLALSGSEGSFPGTQLDCDSVYASVAAFWGEGKGICFLVGGDSYSGWCCQGTSPGKESPDFKAWEAATGSSYTYPRVCPEVPRASWSPGLGRVLQPAGEQEAGVSLSNSPFIFRAQTAPPGEQGSRHQAC